MRPHVYFVMGSFLLGVGIAGIILFSTLLVNILSFRMRAQNHIDYLRFGKPGLTAFLRHFPWPLFLLAIVSTIGGILLIKKLNISYKKNLWGLVAAIIGFVLILGIAMDTIGVNDRMSNLRSLKPFYDTDVLKDQIIKGKVLESGSSTVKIVKPNGEVVVIEIPSELIEKQQLILKDNDVSVFGSWKDNDFIIRDLRPRRMQKQ